MIGLDRWIDPRIRNVTVADVQRYLVAHGWKQKPFPAPSSAAR